MQNINYNQRQTALILAGRTKLAQPTQGDFFAGCYDNTTVTEFNTMVDWYLQAEEDIHALFEWNAAHGTSFVVNGRDEDNNIYPVTDAPSHPFPGRKPTT